MVEMPQILIFGIHWCLAAPTWIDKTKPRKCLCLTDLWIFQMLSWIPFLLTSVTAALIIFSRNAISHHPPQTEKASGRSMHFQIVAIGSCMMRRYCSLQVMRQS